ncbi:MAG: sulfate/molybdate ABC transporter ATP-binding protein [Drouetiella hepatica Uher 2000/2452]|jgi:sulfate transport system ATP-binding protein|uniref:ABC-type quaternary amine transporter n=1 Tax=Drouetiella hepatica Uher 2000/2452 TaxID=904376 RepID=A0A951Q807_9CYAN|nr:sulfate/molybdate ABC transporter ATP-binding protein [Drouetiella hepatica Uher 2000/2452]
MGISVEHVSKHFGDFKAVDQVSVEVKTGSLVALLGPSGSGKSTLLRLIAGLELPDRGKIYLTGQDATHQSVQNRRIGFVFQHYALFKHLTIRQNIAFGLEIAKQPKNRVKHRVEELINLVQLQGMGDRYPSQLSGGQRQRVALARALALEPQVLLLDEPFGALDAKVRKDLRSWLRNLHDTVHVTTVFVTHDQEEAMEVADELVVMNKGRIEQVGSAAELYDNPATPFVMSFIGPVNVLPSSAPIFKRVGYQPEHPNVFLRPHDVLVALTSDEDTSPAIVNRVIHLGWEIQAELALEDGHAFTVYLSREQFKQLNLRSGQRVYVKPKDAKSFAAQYVEA